jgi:hypothetical protein
LTVGRAQRDEPVTACQKRPAVGFVVLTNPREACSRSLPCSDRCAFTGRFRRARRSGRVRSCLRCPTPDKKVGAAPMWPGSSRNRRRDERGRPASPRARLDTVSKLEAGGVADSPREFRSRNPVSPFGGEQVMEKR